MPIADDRLRLDLHLLPSGAGDGRAGGADAAHPRRPDHARRSPAPSSSPEPTLAQRLVRAKRKIRDARDPVPRPARRAAARAARRRAARPLPRLQRGLCAPPPATRSSGASCAPRRSGWRGSLASLLPDEPEALGLLALMLLHDARREARVGDGGELVLLEDQDRVALGRGARSPRAGRCSSGRSAMARPGPYQVQAAIAALHDEAATAGRDRLAPDRRAVRRAAAR